MTAGPLRASGDLDRLDFAKAGGTLAVVAQDAATRAVLMVAAADREALEITLATGDLHLRSRTRGLWRKGATSGDVLRVVSLHADCDGDAVLALVHPVRGSGSAACHTGATSCFGVDSLGAPNALRALDSTVAARNGTDPVTSYTAKLLGDRNLRLKKLGEECAELVTACADGDRPRIVSEAADLLYHMMVAVHAADVTLGDVERELASRARPSSS